MRARGSGPTGSGDSRISRTCQALGHVLGFALVVAALPAQRTITIQNLAPQPRDEWWTTVVPFEQGAVTTDVPRLHVDGHATAWQPFGARWPDGSVRQALCLFRAQVDAGGEQTLALADGAGPDLPPPSWDDLPLDAEAVLVSKGKETRAALQQVSVLEEGPARRVELWRCRLGDSGLLVELLVTRHPDQEHAWASVGAFFSDPTTKAMQLAVDRLEVVVHGLALLVRHANLLGVRTDLGEDGSRTVLLHDQVLGDGQGVRRAGVLAPALRGDDSLHDHTLLAAAQAPAFGATSWVGSDAWGPFGMVPETPPWLQGDAARTWLARRHASFVASEKKYRDDPFAVFRYGLAKQAGQTGDQEDFGVAKLPEVAATGLPSFLYEVEPSVLQEACRPVHEFEAAGTPVQSSDHPDWVVWSGRTHWHCGVSKDRLGKPCPEPGFETHGWTGKDRQHWSSLYLCGYELLTGAPWATREIENEVQLYLAGQTLDPELSTSGTGAPRAAGRVLLTACWLYQCTGDDDLKQRILDRVDKVHAQQWAGRGFGDGKVRPFQVAQPDGRMLQGAGEYWTPWQDALATVGFAAVWKTFGDEQARDLADALALNVLRYGWRVEGDGAPIIATAIRWRKDGAPLSPTEMASGDRTLVEWSYGTDFSTWALGAVEWARQAAERKGDDAMKKKAEVVLQGVRARMQKPDDGGFGRFGSWAAVR